MILPMSAFFLAIAILGGFIIMLSRSQGRATNQMPIGFMMLFAGLGYCLPALILYPLAFYLGTTWGFALLFFAPFVGALVGAVLGYRAGVKRRGLVQKQGTEGSEH
jgi:hypothetical protein